MIFVSIYLGKHAKSTLVLKTASSRRQSRESSQLSAHPGREAGRGPPSAPEGEQRPGRPSAGGQGRPLSGWAPGREGTSQAKFQKSSPDRRRKSKSESGRGARAGRRERGQWAEAQGAGARSWQGRRGAPHPHPHSRSSGDRFLF